MKTQMIQAQGHLIDSGLLSQILNTILSKGADYRITSFDVGKTPEETSQLELELLIEDETIMEPLMSALTPFGVFEKSVPSALLIPAEKDSCAPEIFYSSSNHRTEVYYQTRWYPVDNQRMDAAIVYNKEKDSFNCVKLRDLKKEDLIVCTSDSVRVYPPGVRQDKKGERFDTFAFMTNSVSSERSVDSSVEKIAEEMKRLKENHRKTVVVCGPVVVHAGGADALASLIRKGYVQGFLGGNAVAVHDIENRLFGTSLGVKLQTGEVVAHGHTHHMRAINQIYTCGSIKNAIEQGLIKDGLMYEVLQNEIPYCLAGSIRDDGPLPETVNDMITAQTEYAEIIKDSSLILMLSTMLHSIGVGNMTPSWVKTVCIDINPAVVTKLSDRGSNQAVGIVSDVGLFLRALDERLK